MLGCPREVYRVPDRRQPMGIVDRLPGVDFRVLVTTYLEIH